MSTRKVSDQKILAGVPTTTTEMTDNLSRLNQDILSLQPGCMQTLSRVLRGMWEFWVLSINWSKALIDYSLVQPLNTYKTASINLIPDEIIWSNNIDDQGKITLTSKYVYHKCIVQNMCSFVNPSRC